MFEPGAAKVIKGDCIDPGECCGKGDGANASGLKYILPTQMFGKDGSGANVRELDATGLSAAMLLLEASRRRRHHSADREKDYAVLRLGKALPAGIHLALWTVALLVQTLLVRAPRL